MIHAANEAEEKTCLGLQGMTQNFHFHGSTRICEFIHVPAFVIVPGDTKAREH